MAVPNTTTFSLDDVRIELGLSSPTSLSACFAAAKPGGFDPAYEGAKDRLSNFRNYSELTPTISTEDASRDLNSSSYGIMYSDIYCNTTWEVYSKPSWISITNATYNGDSPNVFFHFSTNTSGATRTGTVVFRTTYGSNDVSASVAVSQVG